MKEGEEATLNLLLRKKDLLFWEKNSGKSKAWGGRAVKEIL